MFGLDLAKGLNFVAFSTFKCSESERKRDNYLSFDCDITNILCLIYSIDVTRICNESNVSLKAFFYKNIQSNERCVNCNSNIIGVKVILR